MGADALLMNNTPVCMLSVFFWGSECVCVSLHVSVLCGLLHRDPHAGGGPVQEGPSLLQIHTRALHSKNESGSLPCATTIPYINLQCYSPFRQTGSSLSAL